LGDGVPKVKVRATPGADKARSPAAETKAVGGKIKMTNVDPGPLVIIVRPHIKSNGKRHAKLAAEVDRWVSFGCTKWRDEC
jgi:hypothetical protein